MPTLLSRMRRLGSLMAPHRYWILLAMMIGIAAIHYLTPHVRPLFPRADVLLHRHAVERVLFILPVAAAAFSIGSRGGVITLAAAILIMLPRALWLSFHPADAVAETIAVAVVGGFVLWTVQSNERERMLHHKAAARMRAFNAVCSIVARSLDLEQVLTESLDKVLEVTDLEIGLMYCLDPNTDELVLHAHRGLAATTVNSLNRVCLEEGPYGQVARSGEPVALEDPSENHGTGPLTGTGDTLGAQIVVPLTSKGKVHGVMALGSYQTRQFPSADRQLISTFGRQIGVGVENAQLHRDVERQLQIQQRLNEVAERVTSELELHRVLPKVLEIAEGLIGAECGFIALFDPATKQLRYPYLHNLPQSLTDVSVPEGEGVAGEAMSTAAPVSIPDYRNYAKAVPAFVDAGLVSVVAVPIVSGNRSFGTLAAGSLHEIKKFSSAEISSLAGVGRQAGIAIDNARLYESMRYYARQITQAQEDERKRIAREAHDETAQILVALSRRLDALTAWPEMPPNTFKAQLDGIRELTTDALQSVRRFSHDLRPPVLDDLGFVAAVRGLARNLEGAGVETSVQVQGTPYRLPPEEELVLFRIAQESLNNIRWHAAASHATVAILFRQNRVRMAIEDDGAGFSVPEEFADLLASGKMGLISMHERAQILGGTFGIDSAAGRGTRILVDAPVHARD